MQVLSIVLFLAALALTAYMVIQRVSLIKRTINMGRDEDRTDRPAERLNQMLLIALGQKKMFNKPLVGFLHFIVYAGFFIINVEILEIIVDGLSGQHRIFLPLLGAGYTWLINAFEVLALGVLLACVIFLARRHLVRIKRFWAREMTIVPPKAQGIKPVTDAALILITEISLMSFFLLWNATDQQLQLRGNEHYPNTGSFIISQALVPLFNGLSDGALVGLERFFWWAHILGVMWFTVYLTYSKHLHIMLAFPNTYYAGLEPKGKHRDMPAITNEVKLALGLEGADANAVAPERFGARDINDLSWKNLMDAYSCTECGRCTAACPANMTGKLLSPRKIMMDTRDRMEDVQRNIKTGMENPLADEKTLYGDYILKEEILACTNCNACVEACPVLINPLDIIQQVRRYVAMDESGTPGSWNNMFNNVERNFAPWAFPPSDRDAWRKNA